MAGMGLIGTAISGGMAGLAEPGRQLGEYAARSTLAREAEAAQMERDARLQEFQATRDANTEKSAVAREGRQETLAVGRETRGYQQAIDLAGQRQTYDTGEKALDRTERASEFKARSDQDERQHTERMAALNKQASQQAAQIGLESRRVAILESNNILEKEDKKVLRDARDAYIKETDPEKKAELGAQYSTVLGKIGERWKPIESVDPNTGAKTITGWYDGNTARQLGPGGRAVGGATTKTGWDSGTGEVFVSGKSIGTAKTEKEARDMAAKAGTAPAVSAAPSAGPAPTKSQGIIGTVQPEISGGPEVDAARARVAAARAKVQSFGTIKMRQDRSGYVAAQTELENAQRDAEAAMSTYQSSVGSGGRAAMSLRQK